MPRELIIDGHLDLAWNALDWKRDLTQPVGSIRDSERGMTGPGRGTNTVSLPALAGGNVGICLGTVLARLNLPGNLNLVSAGATVEAVYAQGQAQIAYYHALRDAGHVALIKSRRELDAHLANCKDDSIPCPVGLIIAMEGADPIRHPADLAHWYQAGLRVISLTHYGLNRYGGGTHTTQGLSADAPALLREIERLGMLLDLTHLSDEAFAETIDIHHGAVCASHQNARHYVDDQRQFSDAQIRTVIERDGVLGAAMDAWMLQPGFRRGESIVEVTLDRVVDNIDHVCQLAGNARHAAIGSDLDGGFGREQSPADLDTIADLVRLRDLLSQRNYTDADIDAILNGNWLRLLTNCLPEE